MLWALVARIRDEHYLATLDDMRALVAAFPGADELAVRTRIRDVLGGCAERWPNAPFSVALGVLEIG